MACIWKTRINREGMEACTAQKEDKMGDVFPTDEGSVNDAQREMTEYARVVKSYKRQRLCLLQRKTAKTSDSDGDCDGCDDDNDDDSGDSRCDDSDNKICDDSDVVMMNRSACIESLMGCDKVCDSVGYKRDYTYSISSTTSSGSNNSGSTATVPAGAALATTSDGTLEPGEGDHLSSRRSSTEDSVVLSSDCNGNLKTAVSLNPLPTIETTTYEDPPKDTGSDQGMDSPTLLSYSGSPTKCLKLRDYWTRRSSAAPATPADPARLSSDLIAPSAEQQPQQQQCYNYQQPATTAPVPGAIAGAAGTAADHMPVTQQQQQQQQQQDDNVLHRSNSDGYRYQRSAAAPVGDEDIEANTEDVSLHQKVERALSSMGAIRQNFVNSDEATHSRCASQNKAVSTKTRASGRSGPREACLVGLEFDGDTVLCRVCGDKASGFHYGVHACEGCKGFFRRSIQQKIQYRPCLKNQQCNIMRVNRNRCQYCRLKKCIAVGMSRDAVRFGRVPKKEKAKILEQMQKVNSTAQSAVLSAMLDNPRDVTRQVVDAHMSISLFTQGKVKELTERVWQHPQFVTCAAHMACPLNPRFEDSNAGKWPGDFTDYFTPAIRNVVSFAKCIPGFSMLNQEDQVTLLKAGTFEVLLLYMAKLFDSKTNTMIFSNGKLYKRPNSTSNQSTNSAGFLLDSMFDFAERLNTMELSDDEIALFSALVIVTSDRPGLRNVEQVDQIQNCLSQGLQQVCSASHPDDPAMFTKLMMKIPDLRTLNTLHSEKLLGMSVPAMSLGGMKPDPMSPTKASPPPANYNHHPYAAAESLIAGYPMMASADLPRSARMSYLEAATSPRMEVRPSVAGGRYDSAVKIATSSSPSEHHPLPAASENLRHHHMSGGGMVGSKDFYQGLNDVRKHLLTRRYGDAAGTKECGSPDFTAALDAGGRESELVDLSMKCPVSRKRLHADDEPISPPKMLKTEPSTHMPSYGQYPIGFPFYPFSPRFTSSDVDMSMLEKLRVNTRHSPVEGDTSPLHSGGSASSSQMPLLTHALNSPPLLSAWKSRNETSSHERDRMSDRTGNKQTDVDDKHRSSLDNEEDGTKVRKLVSHSIDRLMGMSKAERETEDQQSANHERSPTDSRSDSMNRAEPDSTQPDVDAASHHHQQQQEQRCNSHGSSDTKRSVSLSDDDSDAGADDNKPTKWSPPTSRTTPAGPALPLGGFSSAAVHPAQLLYQYSQYNQYAAVQQYAQQMAHHVAVAQLQAAQRAALDVADNRSQSPRQPLNLIGSKFSNRNDVISHVKPEPV